MLYHLLPDASKTNHDPRKTPGPHSNDIVGFTNVKSTDLAMNSTRGSASSESSKPTQSEDVHYVQSSKNPNGDQQPDGSKRKGQNNCKGGNNNNNNKPKDKDNNGKQNDNAGESRKEKCKVKFPFKLCTDDHLTHLCPKLA
jgi:hypothetical protein